MTLKAIDFRFFIGCPCHTKGSSFFSPIDGVDAASNIVIVDETKFDPSEIKPILRKFESLSRHEVEGLNKLWPSESIKRTVFGSIQLDAEIINYLTSLNVDVFGWIEQGLAIDAAYQTQL